MDNGLNPNDLSSYSSEWVNQPCLSVGWVTLCKSGLLFKELLASCCSKSDGNFTLHMELYNFSGLVKHLSSY